MAQDNQPADQPATNQPAPADEQERKSQKEFSLKPIQNQMLQSMQDQYFNGLSNFLSFLALEFWGYTVTPTTKFEVRDGKVYIWEGPAPTSEPPAVATGAPVPAPEQPINANGATADEPSIA